MATRVAEDLHEQVLTAVDHWRRLIEPRRDIDHPKDLDDPLDSVEAAQFGEKRRQNRRSRHSRGASCLFERKVVSDLATNDVRAVDWSVSANVDHGANYDTTEIVSGRRENRRQFNAQLDESVCDHQTRLFNQRSVAVELINGRSRSSAANATRARTVRLTSAFINARRRYELLHLIDDVDGGPGAIFSKRSYLLV